MSDTDSSPSTHVRDWEAVQAAPEFQELRRRLRTFVFPVAGGFFAWYVLYVLLATYATGFMSIKIAGSNLTVGLVVGLLQFVSTFVITAVYVRFANRRLDPLAADLRGQIERNDT